MGVNVRAPAPSPAHARLEAHREAIAAARRKVEDAQRPIRNAEQGLSQVEEEMRQATAAVAAADEAERDQLIAAARSGKDTAAAPKAQDRARAEEKLAAARRRVGLHRDVLHAVRGPHDDAVRELNALREGTGAIVAAVLAEEFERAVAAYDKARAALLIAETEMRSIAAATGAYGRQFGDAGNLARPYFHVAAALAEQLYSVPRYEPSPREFIAGEGRWLAEIAKLEGA